MSLASLSRHARKLTALGLASLALSILLFLFVEPSVHPTQGATNWLHFARGFLIGVALVALIAGLVATSVLGDLPGKLNPHWSLKMGWEVSFTWFAFIGAVAVLAVGIWFRTPDSQLESAKRRAEQADEMADTPLSMR